MTEKLSLYWNTIRYLKLGQIYYRIRKMLRFPCTLGGTVPQAYSGVFPIAALDELDFDPAFLSRFPVDETMKDTVTLFHGSENFRWDTPWSFPGRPPLWNYNLHYFEYVFPIVKAYKKTGYSCYLDKFKEILRGWIAQNPRKEGGIGWNPYPLALRLTNWLSFYTHLEKKIQEDEDFHRIFISSLWEQYVYLARHLEKDLLGNHYLEDLKALILCALFFQDEKMLAEALAEFHRQCREQILPDGMHFELSPMYHKLIFEDILRVAVALRGAGRADEKIEGLLQPMLDVAWSLEEGLERLPLFNDCGNNVAKSLEALCAASKIHFGLIPGYKDRFPDSGYYIFKRDGWKLIVDAGQPGPAYLPGHAHCDAMSFELFKNGKPVLVNCGTYAYQCEERAFFRSTAAHNTVLADGVEQSQCWSTFRMGKRSRVKVKEVDPYTIEMEMTDQNNVVLTRKIVLRSGLTIFDSSDGEELTSFLHISDQDACEILSEGRMQTEKQVYAEEFGKMSSVTALRFDQRNRKCIKIRLN